MTIDHTDPHIGEVGSLLVSPRTVGTVEKEQQVQDQIFSKQQDNKRKRKDVRNSK